MPQLSSEQRVDARTCAGGTAGAMGGEMKRPDISWKCFKVRNDTDEQMVDWVLSCIEA